MNEFTLSEIRAGMKETFTRKITLEMEESFREISGDENPLHKDDDFAREAGKGKYSLIHSFEELSFMKPVFAGDLLTVTGEVFEKEEVLGLIRIKAVIRNQHGSLVSKAKMKVLVMR